MTDNFAYGQMGPYETATEYTKLAFIIKQLLAELRTVVVVQVVSCTNSGGVSPIGTVNVQPMVNMLDGQNNSQQHGTIFSVPYFRLQGGQNGAVIIDPVAGDIGLMLVSDRDFSNVQTTQAIANPGTYRMHDLADGLYIGCFIGQKAPSAYVQFDGQGNINIADVNGNKIQMSSSGIALTGNVAITGTLTATGNITAGQGGGDQVTLQQHIHAANGSPPTPGH
jgi:Phage protein Gp138 N-terminal domain